MTVTSQRLSEAMARSGKDQSALAKELGVTQGAISKIVLGKTSNSRLIPKIATQLGVPLAWLLGMSDAPVELVPSNDDDSVEIDAIDLAYGMGASFLDSDVVEVEKLRFTRGWLRTFTPSPPSSLFIARGSGDSMMPTILDSDVVLVDRSQTVPKMRDQLWAMTMAGMGMIKRLRPATDGSMLILSDNPSVPDDRAIDGELFIVGRVVAISRKV